MAERGMSFSEFQKEKIFSGGNRLRNWKEDGEVTVWIHTGTKIYRRLFHLLKYVTQKQNETTGKIEKAIGYFPFVCHEEVADYFNKKNSGYPSHCPVCRFIEWLEYNGEVEHDVTVWDASVGNRKLDVVCTKADFIGDTEGGGDYRLSFKPALQYIMGVIDNDNVDDGIVVSTEKLSIGEGIKKAIRQEMDRKGPELGDPAINPYAFKWKMNKKARLPADFYEVYVYEQADYTEEIEKLLNSEGLDLSSWVTFGNTDKLYEIMREHITLEGVPLDEFFDNIQEDREMGDPESDHKTANAPKVVEKKIAPVTAAPAPVAATPKPVERKRRQAAPAAAPAPAAEPTPQRRRRAAAPVPAPEPEPVEEAVEAVEEEVIDECGGCGKTWKFEESITNCPHCGVLLVG